MISLSVSFSGAPNPTNCPPERACEDADLSGAADHPSLRYVSLIWMEYVSEPGVDVGMEWRWTAREQIHAGIGCTEYSVVVHPFGGWWLVVREKVAGEPLSRASRCATNT